MKFLVVISLRINFVISIKTLMLMNTYLLTVLMEDKSDAIVYAWQDETAHFNWMLPRNVISLEMCISDMRVVIFRVHHQPSLLLTKVMRRLVSWNRSETLVNDINLPVIFVLDTQGNERMILVRPTCQSKLGSLRKCGNRSVKVNEVIKRR